MPLHVPKQKIANINLALRMLQRGAPFDHVRRVTNLTLAEAARLGWFTEVKVPDPRGYKHDEKGEVIGHDGKVLSTGRFQPQWPTATVPMVKVGGELVFMHPTNKQLKKTSRKAFFDARRYRKQPKEAAHDTRGHQEATQPGEPGPGSSGPSDSARDAGAPGGL